MIDPAFLARVAALGGNPECLHCRLNVLVREHFEAAGDPPAGDALFVALTELAGDALARAEPPPFRVALLRQAIGLMAGRCGFAVVEEKGTPAAPPSLPPVQAALRETPMDASDSDLVGLGLLGLLFTGLKLLGLEASWWCVTLPFWLAPALWLAVLIAAGLIIGGAGLLAWLAGRH